jgi:RND family efflux transporter MFP subunit
VSSKPSPRPFFLGLLFLVLLISAAVAQRLWVQDSGEEKPARDVLPAPVEVMAIEVGPIQESLVLSGSLRAEHHFKVSSKVSGRLKNLQVKIGDRVKNGQVVALLDDEWIRHELSIKEAALKLSASKKSELEVQYQTVQKEVERLKPLLGKGVVSPLDHERAVAKVMEAQVAIQTSKAEIEVIQQEVELAQLKLKYTKVVSEWEGDDRERVISARHVDEGDTLKVGDALVEVISPWQLKAMVRVTDQQYVRLKAGQKAKVTSSAFPTQVFAGELKRLAPSFNESSRQALVEIQVPNLDGHLKPGWFVTVSMLLDSIEGATLVPQSAIVTRMRKPAIYILKKGATQVHQVFIEPGLTSDGWVQLKGHVPQGQVVTLGHHLIKDGSEVKATLRTRSQMSP